eukprot:TRINITY_DN14505_c0_g1_i1.p1 TRINITY_DN14505_c0_g1~~TRINITY_DN14505_c0_g1_i1.p1  ORF type:complete len:483 (-),score=77.82 TRINITY_DN14505_c0_g1_i1:328-1776(-)
MSALRSQPLCTSAAAAQKSSCHAPAVVVVDPFSSGKLLLEELELRRIPMIGIRSSDQLAGFWLAQWEQIRERFIFTIDHAGSINETLTLLKGFDLRAVIAGSEPGVPLAELLGERLGLPSNKASTSAYRHNKFAMQERLRECGLRAIKQLYSSDLDEMLAFCKQECPFPVIVKPAESGGTDGVFWCHSEHDVTVAYRSLIGVRNVNGYMNERVLVQEYLQGVEYVVNCVSHKKQHLCTCMWVYKKKKDPITKSIAYESSTMMESEGKLQDQLRQYVFKCLEAVGIETGPSHSEVIMTSDGPCLVETAARLHGLMAPKLTELATGIGTHEIAVDVLDGAKLFARLGGQQYLYHLKKYAAHVLLLNQHTEGVLERSLDHPELHALPATWRVQANVKVGQQLCLTRDMASSPGVVFQVHPFLEQCQADDRKIRELERSSLYHVRNPKEPASPSSTCSTRSRSASEIDTACNEMTGIMLGCSDLAI